MEPLHLDPRTYCQQVPAAIALTDVDVKARLIPIESDLIAPDETASEESADLRSMTRAEGRKRRSWAL